MPAEVPTAEGLAAAALALAMNAASAMALFSPNLAITLDLEILGRRPEREPLAVEFKVFVADEPVTGNMKSVIDSSPSRSPSFMSRSVLTVLVTASRGPLLAFGTVGVTDNCVEGDGVGFRKEGD